MKFDQQIYRIYFIGFNSAILSFYIWIEKEEKPQNNICKLNYLQKNLNKKPFVNNKIFPLKTITGFYSSDFG